MINVTKTYLPSREKFKDYVDQIFDSGWLTNNGTLVNTLQQRLEHFLGVRNLLLVSSGTLALQIAYKLLKLKGEVITTPFSFVATTSSLAWEGIRPVFADIDQNTLCLDPNEVEKRLTAQTTAIVATHVYGNCCDIESLEKIAKKHHLKLIFDAAHSFHVNYKGKSVFSFGDVSIASFHSTKIFHTIEGGALIIRDDALYKEAERMINFGFAGYERISGLGINGKMNEFEAAMGLCVLDEFDKIITLRKQKYEYYLEQLKDVKGVKFPTQNALSNNNYGYFPIIFPTTEIMLSVMDALKEKQINPRRYFYPSLDELPYISEKFDVPISRDISSRIICIPIYESLDREIQDQIIEIIIGQTK